MPSILDIRIQKLFLIAVILKVGSAFLGWLLQMQWSLGFWLPIVVMAMYIVLGLNRRDRDVTDEKFADSCYFLGFIFTIASIIFSLFDLPNIGTRIQDIAVRFGAAMVTTCAGLVVRVYLVSFKKDVDSATKSVEDSIIDASEIFRGQLVIAYERLRDFQSEVDTAARATAERVNMQIEKLSKDHAEKLTGFFAELTNRNQEAFTKALDEVKSASLRLSNSVEGYSHGMRANLDSIEAKVTEFGEVVTARLKDTTFPDDYFAKHLAPPLDQLRSAAKDVSLHMLQASEEIAQSTIVLSGALKKLNTKAKATEGSLETVRRLTEQQQAVLDVAQGQLTTMERLGETLAGFDTQLSSVVVGLNSAGAATSELNGRVETIFIEVAKERKQLESSLTGVVSKLGENVAATSALSAHIDKTIDVSREVAAKLGANASAAELIAANLVSSAAATIEVAGKLDGVTTADIETAKTLATIEGRATLAISKVDAAVAQLQEMVRQLTALDLSLRTQSGELKSIAEHISRISVVVESSISSNGETQPQGLVPGIDLRPPSTPQTRSWWRLPFGPSKPPTS